MFYILFFLRSGWSVPVYRRRRIPNTSSRSPALAPLASFSFIKPAGPTDETDHSLRLGDKKMKACREKNEVCMLSVWVSMALIEEYKGSKRREKLMTFGRHLGRTRIQQRRPGWISSRWWVAVQPEDVTRLSWQKILITMISKKEKGVRRATLRDVHVWTSRWWTPPLLTLTSPYTFTRTGCMGVSIPPTCCIRLTCIR